MLGNIWTADVYRLRSCVWKRLEDCYHTPPLRSIAAGSLIEPVVCCHIVDVDDNAATSSGAFLHRRSIVEELLSLPLSAGSWLSTIVCFLLTVP